MPNESLDPQSAEAVAAVGMLLIRAAAVLGSLPVEKQEALSREYGLPDHVRDALKAARNASPEVARGLRDHPPSGFSAGTLA